MKKYALFIGRYQPLHDGHLWLFQQALEAGKNVCVAIRDTPVDEKNPFTAEDVLTNVTTALYDLIEAGRVKVIIIPDIASVEYGRGVGYEIIQHEPPKEIGEISATKIREKLKYEGRL